MKRSGFNTMSKYAYPWYIIMHPADGFHEMKINKKASKLNVAIILTCFFLVNIYQRLTTDFDFNNYTDGQNNILILFLSTIGIFFVVTLANWCFCTLLDGKGTMKDICTVFAYALIPYILICFVTTTATNFLSLDEGSFLNYILIVAELWTFIIAFSGLQAVHEYSGKRVIGSMLLTILGALIIIFVVFLFFMLIQQFYSFINTIIIEITRR